MLACRSPSLLMHPKERKLDTTLARAIPPVCATVPRSASEPLNILVQDWPVSLNRAGVDPIRA